MSGRALVELSFGELEVEERPGYLLLAEAGSLTTTGDLAEYVEVLEGIMADYGARKAILDVRGQIGDFGAAVHERLWRWLESGRAFRRLALLVATDLTMAEVNLTAMRREAPVRAFVRLTEAQRWLLQRRQNTSQSYPPPPPRTQTVAKPRRTVVRDARGRRVGRAPRARRLGGTLGVGSARRSSSAKG
ncbi:MAG: hypothetical protein ACFCGT_25070 [Sandaracinaceae bacterium]